MQNRIRDLCLSLPPSSVHSAQPRQEESDLSPGIADKGSKLKFKPQSELSDAVSTRVTDASGENLSECAGVVRVARSSSLSQIVARIIKVWMVGQVGKAALELQPKSFGELEVLGEPQGEVNCWGAN